MLVVLSIFLVVLNMTGVFSALDEKVQQIVSARQKNIIADLSEQFGRMTAQGIAVSEDVYKRQRPIRPEKHRRKQKIPLQ